MHTFDVCGSVCNSTCRESYGIAGRPLAGLGIIRNMIYRRLLNRIAFFLSFSNVFIRQVWNKFRTNTLAKWE